MSRPRLLEVLRTGVRGEVLLADMTDLPFGDGTFDGGSSRRGDRAHRGRRPGAVRGGAGASTRRRPRAIRSCAPGVVRRERPWAGHVRRYTHRISGRARRSVPRGYDLDVFGPGASRCRPSITASSTTRGRRSWRRVTRRGEHATGRSPCGAPGRPTLRRSRARLPRLSGRARVEPPSGDD